jgi:hypothetical protein
MPGKRSGMERASSKTGPRADEELARETRGHVQGGHSPRVEEWREPEPPGEGQPEASRMPDQDETVAAAPPGMTPADVAGRSELASYLRSSAFPADRAALVRVAADENAPDAVLAQLRRLPADRPFGTVTEVWEALGHGSEDDTHRF